MRNINKKEYHLNRQSMKRKSIQGISVIALSVLSLFVVSCKDELVPEEQSDDKPVTAEPLTKAGNVDLPGRLLASNCFQCHGTNGYGYEELAGEDASGIISELNEMKAKDPRKNIMNAHARAYTAEEIKIIANYISKQ